MPIGGTRQEKTMGNYTKDSMYPYAQAYLEVVNSIRDITQKDIFSESQSMLLPRANGSNVALSTLENFFVEGSYDPASMKADEQEDWRAQMHEQFINDVGCLNEHTALGTVNPVVGMVLPIHKNILMNMVFDKGAISKVTAVSPKFTITMETRILVAPDGTEIDMYLDQNKMTAAINSANPTKTFEIALPEFKTVDLVNQLGGTSNDSLDITTCVSEILIKDVYYKVGDILPDAQGHVVEGGTIASDAGTHDTWYPVKDCEFKPGYGSSEDRTFTHGIEITYQKDASDTETLTDVLSGIMSQNKLIISSAKAAITKVRVTAKLDPSNAQLTTASVKWKTDTSLVEIPPTIPINTTISPEEVKDIAALYQVNQLTKVMSLFKTALANYKDDTIHNFLSDDYAKLDARCKTSGEFDFAPREGYALDHVEWRHKTFFDYLDSKVTKLLQVLNDPNMTISIFGDPDLVRKITPTEYTYVAPGSIGPVELDYTRTVVTSDKRVYQFFGSDKMRGNTELMIILCPRNTDRIIYRIYDYQMYVSNEIRNAQNPSLPAIHAFERFKCYGYQAVQGRINILHPSGLIED